MDLSAAWHQMNQQYDLTRWAEVEPLVRQLTVESGAAADLPNAAFSQLLFRVHGSDDWLLESTLERSKPSVTKLIDYYQAAIVAKTQVETFTSRDWPTVEYSVVANELERHDTLRTRALP